MIIEEYIEVLRKEGRSCPKPYVWNEFWLALMIFSKGPKDRPPVPLVLHQWGESHASKLACLSDQLFWAKEHECLWFAFMLLADIPIQHWNKGNDSNWTHCYQNSPYVGAYGWTSDPKPKLPKSERCRLIAGLKADWAVVAGGELGAKSTPLQFTGPKGRRLLVRIQRGARSPSGLAFTALRASINTAIEPHVVDHVDFAPGPGGW